MIYLVLSILTNALIGVIFKLFGKREINTYLAVLINYPICVITASFFMGEWAVPKENFDQPWIYLAIGLGFLFPIIFNLYALAIKHIGIVVSTIFQKMSLIAPVIIGIIYYLEPYDIFKLLGITLALLAIFLIPMETEKNQNSANRKYIWAGILVFLGSALIDSGLFLMEKIYSLQGNDLSFLATLFFFAGIGSLPIFIIDYFKNKRKIRSKDLIAGVALGVPNFFSIFFILKGLSTGIDGSIFFPINNVGILLFSALAGIFFFSERMNKYKYLGFALSILAIVLLNI